MTNMFNTTMGDDLETFIERLPQTVAWCSRVTELDDLATAFRGSSLEPSIWDDGRKTMIENVARCRELYTRYKGTLNIEKDIKKLAKGRLLVYYPDLTLMEGATQAETRGYFDIYDAPPWDTWVGYFCETEEPLYPYLVSWVPAVLIDIVSRGIGTSSTECIVWLDERKDLALYKVLKEQDLL